jgi:hypothetical protein
MSLDFLVSGGTGQDVDGRRKAGHDESGLRAVGLTCWMGQVDFITPDQPMLPAMP